MLTLSHTEGEQDPLLLTFLASHLPEEPPYEPQQPWPAWVKPSVLDPHEAEVRANPALLAQVLKAKYHDAFVRDAVDTGHGWMHEGQFFCRTKLSFEQFAGLLLEGYVVRQFAQNPVARRAAITWCSGRQYSARTRDQTGDYVPVGTGHAHASTQYPWLFNPSDPHVDIAFIRKVSAAARRRNPLLPEFQRLLMEGAAVTAGIQVKAITGDEERQIITPLIEGKYACVLTLLHHADGQHSWNVCQRLLHKATLDKRITFYDQLKLSTRICAPSQLYLNQNEIDAYYSYIAQWMQGMEPAHPWVVEGINAEVKEEKYGASLLVPSNEILAPTWPAPGALQ